MVVDDKYWWFEINFMVFLLFDFCSLIFFSFLLYISNCSINNNSYCNTNFILYNSKYILKLHCIIKKLLLHPKIPSKLYLQKITKHKKNTQILSEKNVVVWVLGLDKR